MESFDLRAWPQLKSLCQDSDIPFIIDDIVIDSRRIASKKTLFVAMTGENFDGHDFLKHAQEMGACAAIVRKDVALEKIPPSLTLFKVEDPLRALQQIAACYRRQMKAKVIAITGSFGKTMLKDLLQELVSSQFSTFASPESFNSQLGVALSLFKIRKQHEVALIEAGISKPNEMKHHLEMIQPDHVIITNIGTAHIASMGSKEAIWKEKFLLLSKLKEGNWALIPSTPSTKIEMAKFKKLYFWDLPSPDLPQISRLEPKEKYCLNYEVIFPNGKSYSGSILEGLSYVIDLITIGVRACYLLGVKEENIIEALKNYSPEPMRIELWKSQNGTTLINDTYSADPMSCDIALKQFESLGEASSKKTFLFGGLREKSEHPEQDMQRVSYAVAKHKVDLCILWQKEHSQLLVESLKAISPKTEILLAPNEKAALNMAKAHLGPHDLVLVKGPKKRAISELIRDFDESLPNNQVIINLAAIQSNIETIRAKVGKSTRIMVMVKALAYGTDDIRITKFLKTIGVDVVGVSYVDEGVSLRLAGCSQDIFVMNACDYEAAKACKYGLQVAVSEPILIAALEREAAAQNKKVKVHLHIDTGMGRLGSRPCYALELAHFILSCPHLIFEGIMTHLACADDPNEDAFTMKQVRVFEETISLLQKEGIDPPWKHAANSSGSLRFSFPHFNMIRIGLSAYGLHTSSATHSFTDLRPAISLTSRIVGINECVKGDTISYSRRYTVTQEKARIAVLPIGYFDGLHRNYSGKHSVIIRGKKAPMVGSICMDYMMCDITSIPHASIGDPVLIFGEDDNGNYNSPEELAHAGNSIVHELMTCLGPRIRRLFIYDESLRPR